MIECVWWNRIEFRRPRSGYPKWVVFGFKSVAALRSVKRNLKKISCRLPHNGNEFISATLMSAKHFFKARADFANNLVVARFRKKGTTRDVSRSLAPLGIIAGSERLIEFAVGE